MIILRQAIFAIAFAVISVAIVELIMWATN
jgi:hypothetical protein